MQQRPRPSSYDNLYIKPSAGDARSNASSMGYKPNAFDLITPYRDGRDLTSQSIPSTFLEAEAVESAVLLGEGASFVASLQKIPEGPERIDTKTFIETFTVTSTRPAPPRPRFVVYKTARLKFDKDGVPVTEHSGILQSILTEYHALIYPPLYNHQNIIDFLGIAWGSNPFSPAHKLPALILEYAEHGTLAGVLKNGLDYTDKALLSLDVAKGLSALHEAGLVHGDVKAENVLVCSGDSRKFVAKLGDFGFSVVTATEATDRWMGGTNPWKAPEVRAPVPVPSAFYTDVYSLGLLLWLIYIDGMNPFDLVVDAKWQGLARTREIGRIKHKDTLITLAQGHEWARFWFSMKYGSGSEKSLAWLECIVMDSIQDSRFPIDIFPNFFWGSLIERRVSPFLASLKNAFKSSLSVEPHKRDLLDLIHVLEAHLKSLPNLKKPIPNLITTGTTGQDSVPTPKTKETTYAVTNNSGGTKHYTMTSYQKKKAEADVPTPVKTTIQNVLKDPAMFGSNSLGSSTSHSTLQIPRSKEEWVNKGYKKSWLSWQKMRDLAPSVQAFMFSTFQNPDPPRSFTKCGFLMNGYGCQADQDQALMELQKSADAGQHESRAYAHRIFAACGIALGTENLGRQYLSQYATAGSRAAIDELRNVVSAKELQDVDTKRGITQAGVGAMWYDLPNMLGSFQHGQRFEDDWLLSKVQQYQGNLERLIVNKRGDTILHFAATCGQPKTFRYLMRECKLDINLQNEQGETPLVCATRSGHGGIVIVCLNLYKGDASIAATNGETAMHWLSQFEDAYISPMVKDLLAQGANVAAETRKSVNHSVLNLHIDVDVKLPGTPLAWAVHQDRPYLVKVLLLHGADPDRVHPEGIMTSLLWAAHYHYTDCLAMMIQHLESKVTEKHSDGTLNLRHALWYGPVVKAAIHAADKFSMILRNGAKYLERLHSTLDLLREKTQLINFQGSNVFEESQGSLLYYAVTEAHDEVVEYMLDKEWRIETLNDPCGPARRTPLLEAVRWNRPRLCRRLISHGADIYAMAANPFNPDVLNWSALHIFVQEGHYSDLSLVRMLINGGLPVDGLGLSTNIQVFSASEEGVSSLEKAMRTELFLPHDFGSSEESACHHQCETPYTVAVRRNAFPLASTLTSLGANPNALRLTSGLFSSPCPLTPLGHTIISNARYSAARLRYLLSQAQPPVDFIVEPQRQLTALHRAAMGSQDVLKVLGGPVLESEFDKDTNAEIFEGLLEKWKQPKDLNAKSRIRGNTALHLAVESGNEAAVEILLEAGADTQVENDLGETAGQLAKRLRGLDGPREEIASHLTDSVRER